jgi:AraC-like DNA-binding protein
LLIEDGEVEVVFEGEVHQAKGGCILFFSRFEEHSIRVIKNPYKRYVMNISPKINEGTEVGYKRFSILFNRPEGFVNIVDISAHFAEIREVFDRIIREKNSEVEASEDILGLYGQELILQLFRYFPDVFKMFDDEKNELIYKIQKDFEINYNQEIALADLAKKYNISQSYLSHIFKATTGKSVKGYLLACRITAAKKYLAGSNKRIGEVVELCGFSDSSNFSRLFKRVTGLSPLDFRQKYHNKEIEIIE